jgi:hypothetical protein
VRQEVAQPKVGEFCAAIGRDEDVLEFDVAMSDPESMQIGDGTDHVVEVAFGSIFVETFVRLDNLVQVAALAKLHHQKHISSVDNQVLQLSDAGMADLAVDTKLVDEMTVIILRLHQVKGNDFASVDAVGTMTVALPYPARRAGTQELRQDVLTNLRPRHELTGINISIPAIYGWMSPQF